ncbi:MAG: hypothetical protein AB1551_01620 [Actinomycetota bacterium]
MEQPVVEGLKVMWTQAPQADAAEGGNDMRLEVVGTRSRYSRRAESLARWPPGGQERAEAQRLGFVMRAVAFANQPGSEPLGVPALAAGRMPAPSLSYRDRVDAFVNDGVPAVAPLSST